VTRRRGDIRRRRQTCGDALPRRRARTPARSGWGATAVPVFAQSPGADAAGCRVMRAAVAAARAPPGTAARRSRRWKADAAEGRTRRPYSCVNCPPARRPARPRGPGARRGQPGPAAPQRCMTFLIAQSGPDIDLRLLRDAQRPAWTGRARLPRPRRPRATVRRLEGSPQGRSRLHVPGHVTGCDPVGHRRGRPFPNQSDQHLPHAYLRPRNLTRRHRPARRRVQ